MDAQKVLKALGQAVVRKHMALEYLAQGKFELAREEAVEAMATLETFIGYPDHELLTFKQDFMTIIEQNLLRSSL